MYQNDGNADDQLWQSVTKILTTPTGSRVMRRDFGSVVPDLLDAPQNTVTRMQLMGAPRRMPSMAGYALEITGYLTPDSKE